MKYEGIKRAAISGLKSSLTYVQDCTELGDLIDVLDEAKHDLDDTLDAAYKLDLEEMKFNKLVDEANPETESGVDDWGDE